VGEAVVCVKGVAVNVCVWGVGSVGATAISVREEAVSVRGGSLVGGNGSLCGMSGSL
jgi:hypothetical protein